MKNGATEEEIHELMLILAVHIKGYKKSYWSTIQFFIVW
jgi:alkylhydroperoxidase/carboxymuconolactone decarboxylase family protein YurZ